MSDTIVVMKDGRIQQIGTPIDIYNEPKNAFVADFIGESNIIGGTMLRDYLVKFAGIEFKCVDRGFNEQELVDVVIRPEDIQVVAAAESQLQGEVIAVTFKGVHYEMIVGANAIRWKIQSTDMAPVGANVGLKIEPEAIHIMKKVAAK